MWRSYCFTTPPSAETLRDGDARRGSRSPRDSRSCRVLNINRERVRAAEHAPRGPCRLLEHRHGLGDRRRVAVGSL